MRRLPIFLVFAGVVLFALLSSLFIVNEKEQALVLQFGQVKRTICGGNTGDARTYDLAESCDVDGPGLYFKLPVIQEVVRYEDRILPLETVPLEVTPADNRRLVVDAFARWRITDPVAFRQRAQNVPEAERKLKSILNAALREVLGAVNSADVLSPERTILMQRIRDVSKRQSASLGVDVVDVRIRRADLPEQNLSATFARMNAEREREARDERARGKERAQELRAEADRKALELVSDAQRQAEIIRGEADAERNNIYADSYGRDPEFFAFYRSLKAYERSIKGSNSTLVISPDSEFFDYLKTDGAPAQR